MRVVLFLFLLVPVCFPVMAEQPVEEVAKDSVVELDPSIVDQVANMIRFQMRKCPAKKISKNIEYRKAWARDIVRVAQETDQPIPEHLFTMLLFRESTFRTNAVGAKGERGVGQVMDPGRYGCDQSTRIGQLRCSANYLRSGYAKCGTWQGALSHYQSSTAACKPKPGTGHESKVNFRVRKWVKLRRLFPIDNSS